MELSELGGGITRHEVGRHEAAALAEEHPEEAEAAFLRASAPDDAVRLWMNRAEYTRALTLAEKHAPHMVLLLCLWFYWLLRCSTFAKMNQTSLRNK